MTFVYFKKDNLYKEFRSNIGALLTTELVTATEELLLKELFKYHDYEDGIVKLKLS